MLTETSTVSGLVARFALRRRANTSAFAEGVRLARLGAVKLEQISPDEVCAQVEDGGSFAVRVYATEGLLLGECPCAAEHLTPCRHQVAVAHVMWIRGRRGDG